MYISKCKYNNVYEYTIMYINKYEGEGKLLQ